MYRIRRSAESPLCFVNRFPGTLDIGALHDNFEFVYSQSLEHVNFHFFERWNFLDNN
uniref:Uncharacterized protein n=1 Tax=Triticum urartu TaxID=4572 RepID=A0A8R7UWJ4_TRIUA